MGQSRDPSPRSMFIHCTFLAVTFSHPSGWERAGFCPEIIYATLFSVSSTNSSGLGGLPGASEPLTAPAPFLVPLPNHPAQ